MRCLVRRVSSATVRVGIEEVGRIGKGLLVYLGIEGGDQAGDLCWLVNKLIGLRLFSDSTGRMNEPLPDDGGILLISQFTLLGSLKKGYRPSFNRAAEPAEARRLYEDFLAKLRVEFSGTVAQGAFGEHMQIEAMDDGPVSIWLDSRQKAY
jgi:D-tyrosyl-tRNA(Tyr) deacylase